MHTGISLYQMCTRSTFQVKGGIYLRANPINSLAASIGNTLPTSSTVEICVCMLSHSVLSNTLQPHGLQLTRFLCPWGFSRQEYRSGLPCSLPGDLTDPEFKPGSPSLLVDSLQAELPGKSQQQHNLQQKILKYFLQSCL